MTKKNKNIIIVGLLGILILYVYLMGGPSNTIEQIKSGNYFTFEDKAKNNEYVDVLVEFYEFNLGNYTTRINLNERNKLVEYQESLGFNHYISEQDAQKLIKKYHLNKVNKLDDKISYTKVWFTNEKYKNKK